MYGEQTVDVTGSPSLNVKETAAYLGLSDQTIRAYANNDVIPHWRAGKKIMFVQAHLDAFRRSGGSRESVMAPGQSH